MATLKISDLSVGDWVQNMNGNYVKVAGIWQGCNSNYQVDLHHDGVIGTIASCNIHPIPITAEILEANGFERPDKKVYMDTWSWTNKEDTMIEVSMYKDKAYIRVARFEDGILRDRDCNFGLNYIHQLQHALRLAGVDKEIYL